MRHLFLFVFFISAISLQATNSDVHPKIPTSAFIENVGQLENMNSLKPENDVLFYISTPNAFMYLRKGGISYVFHHNIYSKTEMYDEGVPKIEKIEWQRVDVDFVGATTENVIKENPVNWTYNFFYAHCPNGIMDVKAYQSLTFKNVYPGIDWHIYFNAKGELKYDFIVSPGANPNLIKLKYNYSNQPQLNDNGNVQIKNKLGTITENAPEAIQASVSIPIKWDVKNNLLTFNINSYNKDLPLTIDPYLIWSTYLGSTGSDYSDGIACDDSILVVTGYTTSSGFPTLNGGDTTFFQGSLVASADVFIAKFTADGVPQWITYYGGSGNDNNNGRVLVTPNFIFVAGQTGSTDFPTYNPGNGAYYDGVFPTDGEVFQGYILKFDRKGHRLWATYLDGHPDPGYIASLTANSSSLFSLATTMSKNFPTLDPGNGAYFQAAVTNNSITHYAISKFDLNTNAMQWSTYFSSDNGADGDWNNIVCDENHLFLVGNTSSPTFPTLDLGNGAYFQSAMSASRDGVIARFSTQGVLEWSTYFGGNGDDEFRACALANGKLWVGGNTSSTDFPLMNIGNGAYFQSANGGALDGVIASFDFSGHLLWSTYYGGNGSENVRSITADNYGIWICVKTGSSNLPLLNIGTPTYYLSSYSTAFLVKFKQNGIRQWATYLKAGDPRRLTVNSTNVYVAGYTSSGNLVLQNPGNGAYFQPAYGGSTWDAFIMEFDKCVIPVVSITSDTSTICKYDSTWIYGHGGISYFWNTTDSIDSLHISPLNTSTYTVTVTDDMTCSNTDSIKVTVYPLPNVHITGAHPICFKDSIELHGNGAQTYQWMPDSLSGDSIHVSPPDTTIFYVLGTDTNNCKNIDSAQVIVYPLPNVHINGVHPICYGDSIILAANGAQTYLWTPGNYTTDSIHVAPYYTTTYYLLGTDTNLCKNIDSAKVTVYSLPNVYISGTHPICFGDTITLTAGGALTYNWYPDSLSGNEQTYSPDTTSEYVVIGTDFHNCKNSDTAKVVVYPLPHVQILGAHPICYGDYIDLTAVNAETYSWNTGDTTGLIHVNPPQTFDFIVVGTDTNGCINSDTAQVLVHPLPPVSISGVHPICHYDSISVFAVGATNYTWFPWGYHSSNISVSPDSTTEIILMGVDNNGCVNSDTAKLIVYPLPDVYLTGVRPICFGDSLTVTAHGADVYSWSPVNLTGDSVTLSPTVTTLYQVLGTDTNRCKNTADFSVTVFELPVAQITGINRICQEEVVTLQASGGNSYIWNTSDTTSEITVEPMNTTTYSVIAIKNICSDTTTYTVTVDPKPHITLTSDTTIIIGMTLPLHVTGADTYIWTPVDYLSCTSCSNPTTRPSETTQYCVEGVNLYGCSDTACVNVTVDKECGETFVPSAFSPNGDGNNDLLYVRGKCIKTMQFEIYNRWGEKVFQSTDPTIPWDGTFKGKSLDTGVFVYYLKAEYYNGAIINQKGNITLIR